MQIVTQTPKPHLKIVGSNPVSPVISLSGFNAWYGDSHILNDINLRINPGEVTCIVGPSGSGKSTLLRSLNRINESDSNFHISGSAEILGRDIFDYKDVTQLRSAIGMVFQTPTVFARSISENVLFGVRGRKLSKRERAALAEACLRNAALWADVSHRLEAPASTLSLGQKQRLCIARALAAGPQILLMDEPTASVDPVSARAIEDLVLDVKSELGIVMVTHDLRQARRVADTIVFMCDGQIIEAGPCGHMLSKSALPKTKVYLSEKICDC